jgi:hypothetical protein
MVGTYQAIAPERCEYDDDKCRKILADIYALIREINDRIEAMLRDDNRLYDFAYDTPLEVGPLSGKGTYTGHYQQADGKQRNLRKRILDALKYKCKVPKEAWDAAFRKIPLVPRRHG